MQEKLENGYDLSANTSIIFSRAKNAPGSTIHPCNLTYFRLPVIVLSSCFVLFNRSSWSQKPMTTLCQMEILIFWWLNWDQYLPLAPTQFDIPLANPKAGSILVYYFTSRYVPFFRYLDFKMIVNIDKRLRFCIRLKRKSDTYLKMFSSFLLPFFAQRKC